MAHLSWDALGGDPTPGDPAAFAEIARDFADTAGNPREAYRSLNRLAAGVDDSIWRGEGADAFREELGKLPPQLKKLHDS